MKYTKYHFTPVILMEFQAQKKLQQMNGILFTRRKRNKTRITLIASHSLSIHIAMYDIMKNDTLHAKIYHVREKIMAKLAIMQNVLK
jgi:hypothetical protein